MVKPFSATVQELSENNITVNANKPNNGYYIFDMTILYTKLHALYGTMFGTDTINIILTILEDMVLVYNDSNIDSVAGYTFIIGDIVGILEYDLANDVDLIKGDSVDLDELDIIMSILDYNVKVITNVYDGVSKLLNKPNITHGHKFFIPYEWNIVDRPGNLKFKAELTLHHHIDNVMNIL